MAGNIDATAPAHDVADGASRARPAGHRRDIAVGGDTSDWNPADDRQHARDE